MSLTRFHARDEKAAQLATNNMVKLLVVGQTPPPFGGQSIMIKQLLDSKYSHITFHHIPMQFSKEMDQIGTFTLVKLFELLRLIARIIWCRLFQGVRVLYYPPAGPNRIPILRDLAILISTRWLFHRTIFHFHAGGVSEVYSTLHPALKYLFRKAYFFPDIAIRTSHLAPDDGKNLKAKMDFVIPNGIEDPAVPYLTGTPNSARTPIQLLYAGLLSESKGLNVLLDACHILNQKHLHFHLHCLGVFKSRAFEIQSRTFLRAKNLESHVTFHGEVSGTQKWDAFSTADIFCFPSHFEAETFGLSVLEAMSFCLPVIATRWRGIPSVVKDEFSGLLIPIKDSEALAIAIERLMCNPTLRVKLGKHGRELFLENYSIQKHRTQLGEVFKLIA